MNISHIKINNFKSIKKLRIDFNRKLNVLIGENNIGKTTILEAMLLWKKCYDANIQKKKNKFYANTHNIAFSDLDFLRVADDEDLFNTLNKKSGSIEIEVSFEDNGKKYDLGFEIGKVYNIDNAYLQLKYLQKDEFIKFEKLAINYDKKLDNIIMFFETRPIANIISKEPYMYKGQVLSKISKGKGYEVLRNKIISHKEGTKNIEQIISRIIGEKIEFREQNKVNKEYIKLMVNKGGKLTDLLSQGSGFLQLAEIFSAIEYVESELYILLIDEPDSHIHTKLQNKLLEELRKLDKSQLFLITHNERFLNTVKDEEIIFINEKDKKSEKIEPLKPGDKSLVLEELIGNLEDIEKLKYADKIIFVEGYNDKKIINLLYDKYKKIGYGIGTVSCYFEVLTGIDRLDTKLEVLSQTYRRLSRENVSWILIRDTDFTALRDIEQFKSDIRSTIRSNRELNIIFQNGYGIESTLFSERDKLNNFLSKYYNVDKTKLNNMTKLLNSKYIKDCKIIGNDLYKILKSKFTEQENRRMDNKLYKNLDFDKFIEDVDDNIQYIMHKKIIDMYLDELHNEIKKANPGISCIKLDSNNILDIYIDKIESINDFYESHITLLKEVFEIENQSNGDDTNNVLESESILFFNK